MKRWAVFISGRGSNLQSWLDETEQSQIALVLSSNASAEGLLKAKRFGVATEVLEKKIDWAQLQNLLNTYRVTHLMLAGFMKILPDHFVNQWTGRIFNLHPSLLPSFPGLQALEKSFANKAPLGVSLHEVVAEMDAGPLVYQKSLNAGQFPQFWGWNQISLRTSLAEHQLMRNLFLSENHFV